MSVRRTFGDEEECPSRAEIALAIGLLFESPFENEDAKRRFVRVLRDDCAGVVMRFGKREASALPNKHSAAEVGPIRND